MFSYERSVSYPHGHRNCIFAQRGVRTLPRLAEPDRSKRVAGVHADDTKMLYRYLKEFDGICASHTSATGMGTDWRDNDPQVEPIVEIYQGDRMSYEIRGRPRAGYDPKARQEAGQHRRLVSQGLHQPRPGEGLPPRLPVVERSLVHAHLLLHRPGREARPRRHPRRAQEAPLLRRDRQHHPRRAQRRPPDGRRVQDDRGPDAGHPRDRHRPTWPRSTSSRTARWSRRSSRASAEYKGTWTDPKPTAGVHYYYVRVQQADGQLAWGSPMWIDYSR